MFSYAPSIEIRGKKKLREFLDSPTTGVTIVSRTALSCIRTHSKSDPALVRAFVPATIKGFLYARQHPDEAIATVQKYNPTANAGRHQTGIGVGVEDLGHAEHQGQAAGVGFGRRLGRYDPGAQAIRRRDRAAAGEPALYQRVRAGRRGIRAATGVLIAVV